MRRPAAHVLVFLFATGSFAQQPLVEKIEVSIVNVDVTVTDRAGHAVRGLTRDDFEILDDGEPQPITNFYSVDDRAGTVDDRFRRKVLVLIDVPSITVFERNRALERLEQFIDDRFHGGEYDWSIATIDDGLRILLPPTSDKAAIHEALSQIRKDVAPPLSLPGERSAPVPTTRATAFSEALERWQQTIETGESVNAIVDAMRSFAAADGRKILLLLTGQLLPFDTMLPGLVVQRDRMIREANASNVAVCIINPEGVAAGDPSMYWLARETGGLLMPGNDVDASLRQFDDDASTWYSLGYRSPHPDDSGAHRITVRLKKRSDDHLQYRDGYSALSSDAQTKRTLGSRFGAFMIGGSAIPVTLTFNAPRPAGDSLTISMKTTVPADALAYLPSESGKSGHVDIVVSLFDDAGRSVWFVHLRRDANLGKSEAPTGVFNESTDLYLTKGKPYRVVVAVRDLSSNEVGVAEQRVEF